MRECFDFLILIQLISKVKKMVSTQRYL